MSDPAPPTSLLDIAIRRFERDPSTPYLMTIDEQAPHDVHTITYGDAIERAVTLARALADRGVAPGDRVGCYMTNSPSWVVASLAVWLNRASVAAVGAQTPSSESADLFELAEVSVVVAVTDAPALNDRTVVRVDDGGLLVDGPGPAAHVDTSAFTLPSADDLALAIFTSGTTGRPKGVTHTHDDIVASARNVASAYARTSGFRPDPAPAHLAPGILFNPYGHMAGYSRLAFRMWIGRALVTVPRFTVPTAAALLDRFDIDSLQLGPTMIHMLATTEHAVDMSSVQYVTSGTAPLSIATRDLFEGRYDTPVMQAYGMTETGAVAQERYADVVAGKRGPGSVGRISAGVEVRFRPLDGESSADGGEILVRSSEVTEEFIGGTPVPRDADGWFATGDAGRLEDGILYITGRVHDMIIVGGFNVYPAEIEDAARRSDLVADAVVVGLPDERLGEIPVAGIVWAGSPDPDALIAELRDGLARYKTPRSIFSLDAVPLTPRDKVDRRKAVELAQVTLGAG